MPGLTERSSMTEDIAPDEVPATTTSPARNPSVEEPPADTKADGLCVTTDPEAGTITVYTQAMADGETTTAWLTIDADSVVDTAAHR